MEEKIQEKINYNDLPEVEVGDNITTITQLAANYMVTQNRVKTLLKKAGVAPIGKILNKDTDGKNRTGKPKLAYDTARCSEAIKGILPKNDEMAA